MKSYEYISILSTTIWIVVPIFYQKSKHFWFFLFLGASDVVASILWFGFDLSSQTFWIPIRFLVVFSIDRAFFLKNRNNIMFGFVIITALNYYSTTYIQYIFGLFANAIILTIFIKYLFWEYIEKNKVNVFYAIMTFYGLFSVYKSVLSVADINLGLNNFFVITIFQIFIGLYLIFIKRDVLFSLKKLKP